MSDLPFPPILGLAQAAAWAQAVVLIKLGQFSLSKAPVPNWRQAGWTTFGIASVIATWGAWLRIGGFWQIALLTLWSVAFLWIGRLLPLWLKESEGIKAEIALIREGMLLAGTAVAASFLPNPILPSWLQNAGLFEGRIVVISLLVWSILFLSNEGTDIVRGMISKGGVEPGTPGDPDGESKQHYQAGRFIGIIERLILFVIVIVGKYEALGILLAAKGLIRSKEFEVHSFAEYFILGTLVSTMEAVAIGIIFSVFVLPLWGISA